MASKEMIAAVAKEIAFAMNGTHASYNEATFARYDRGAEVALNAIAALPQGEDVGEVVERLIEQAAHVELGIACRYPDVTDATRELLVCIDPVLDLVQSQAAQIASLSAKVAEVGQIKENWRRLCQQHEQTILDERTRASELQREVERLRETLKMPDANRRLWLISDLLAQNGHFNRADICNASGVSVPQASLDIKRWIALHPHAAVYNRSTKRYEIARAALPQEGK